MLYANLPPTVLSSILSPCVILNVGISGECMLRFLGGQVEIRVDPTASDLSNVKDHPMTPSQTTNVHRSGRIKICSLTGVLGGSAKTLVPSQNATGVSLWPNVCPPRVSPSEVSQCSLSVTDTQSADSGAPHTGSSVDSQAIQGLQVYEAKLVNM